MTQAQQKISFFLTGSMDEQSVEELRGPIAQQNGSPNLSESRNTRLSLEKGTCTRCPDQQPIGITLPANAPCFGIVGNEKHRNYVLYATPDQGARMVGEDGYEVDGTGLVRDRFNNAQQNAFVPLQMSRAGALAAVRGKKYPTFEGLTLETHGIASAYNPVKDHLWVAWAMEGVGLGGNNLAIYASCYDGDGTVLVAPFPVVLPQGGTLELQQHLGLTSQGALGTFLWYGINDFGVGDPGVYCRALDVLGTDAVLGPQTKPIAGIQNLRAMFGVASDGAQYAYLGTGQGTTGSLHKIDMATLASVANAPTANGLQADHAQVAVSYQVVNGEPRIAVLYASTNLRYAVYDASLAVVVSGAKGRTGTIGPAYAQFLACPVSGITGAFFAYSFVEGTGGTSKADPPVVNFTSAFIVPLDGSPRIDLDPLYGAVLEDKGATWVVSDSEMYPLMFVAPDWGRVADGIGGYWNVLDPQIIGYTAGPSKGYGPGMSTFTAVLTPIARMGVVRGTLSPAYHATDMWYPSASGHPRIVGAGTDEFFITYKKADGDTPGRWVRLSVVPENPAVINDRDGIAIAACALPVSWDGVETVEYGGPLTAPHLNVVEDDLGGFLPQGVYGLTCIYRWRDAAGLLHRSMPCPTLTIEIAADNLAIFVRAALPLTMRNGWPQEPIEVLLYMTQANGTSYHEIPFPRKVNDDYVEMSIASPPSDAQPIIYSRGTLGEELVPQPPPPLRDLCIVGSRAWGIDAEVPTRIVYSKLRVAGIGFEFFPAGEVIVPSNAGEVIALREMAGTLILFAERGIYQVSDGGPNNMGIGSFGSPYKLSEVGTHARQSVCATPNGILFVDNTLCFSLLAGGAVTPLPGATARTMKVTGSFLLENADEAVFVIGDECRVFNYSVARWTAWDLPSAPTLTAQSAITRDIGLLYAPGTGRTYTMDSHVIHPTALMRWETDWLILGGDFQDYLVSYDVLFNAYRMSPHAMRLELLTEYDGVTATTLREWTEAELAAIVGVSNRYTIRFEPVRQDARALKLRVSELTNTGNHRGCKPGSVTIVYSVDGLTYEESNIPGSYK